MVGSFFLQTRDVFGLDPSVYCVSMGHPLYPAQLPEMVLKSRKKHLSKSPLSTQREENETPKENVTNKENGAGDENGRGGKENGGIEKENVKENEYTTVKTKSLQNLTASKPKTNQNLRNSNPETKGKTADKINRSNDSINDGQPTFKKELSDKIKSINKKKKEISHSEFSKQPSKSRLRRVDHFLFGGATMVSRGLLKEVVDRFKLPPFPASRSDPRPKNFVPIQKEEDGKLGNIMIKYEITSKKEQDERRENREEVGQSQINREKLPTFDVMVSTDIIQRKEYNII